MRLLGGFVALGVLLMHSPATAHAQAATEKDLIGSWVGPYAFDSAGHAKADSAARASGDSAAIARVKADTALQYTMTFKADSTADFGAIGATGNTVSESSPDSVGV